MGRDHDEVAGSYDRLAGAYAERISDELDGKPFDRALLDRFADQVRGQGFVLDFGCGPGHVARYLHQRDVRVVGIDLSPGMIETARSRTPEVDFRVGDMRALDLADASAAGGVIFFEPDALSDALRTAGFEMVEALTGLRTRASRPRRSGSTCGRDV